MNIFRAMEMMDDGTITRMPIFQERGYIDEVTMKRMLSLQGKTHFPTEDLDLFEQTEFFTQDKEFYLTFILCLIPPNVSRKRGSKKDFLDTLYEQHLRFHYEMINYQKLSGNPCPITYVCLDFSGSPEENYTLLKNTVETVLAPAGFK
jgi:hypothetical protein